MDQLIFTSFSHTHYYWYEVGMLKIPAYHVGEKPAVILYTCHINRLAGTPNKTRTKSTMSLDYNSICDIGSRSGCVSLKEIYHVMKRYIYLQIL